MTDVRQQLVVAVAGATVPRTTSELLRQLAPRGAMRVVYVEDDDLMNAAALPFTAEFCPLTNVRREIDQPSLQRALAGEARTAARTFHKLAGSLGCHCDFEVQRGAVHHLLAQAMQGSDTVLLPRAAGERPSSGARVLVLAGKGDEAGRAVSTARRVAEGTRAALEQGDTEQHLARAGGTDISLIVVTAGQLEAAPQLLRRLVATARAPLLVLR